MDFVIKEKIRVGISACNFGNQVRWNHVGWDRVQLLKREKNDYVWIPVCPEILSGFGTPRLPIKLSVGTGDDFWNDNAKVKNRKGQDVSSQMKQGAQQALDIIQRSQVEAFAFMEGSPSCGVYRTTLKDKRLGRPPGVFGSLLLKQDLFLIPVLDFDSPWKWWDWSRRLHAFAWLKRLEIKTKKDLYDAWHVLKFMCQEVDDQQARQIGVLLANLKKSVSRDEIIQWKKQVYVLLRKPSTLKRIVNIMIKHYAHYRKQFGLKAVDVQIPDADLGKRKFVDDLIKMEVKAFDQGYCFPGNPIRYRPLER